MTTAGEIFFQVESWMQDYGNSRWDRTYTSGSQTDPSLLFMLRKACLALLRFKPSAFATVGNIQFSSSGVKQTLPTDHYLLLDITRNMGADGSTAGNAITPLPSRRDLDVVDLDWYSSELSSGISHFVYEPDKDRRTVWVYEGVPSGGWYVEAQTADYPGTIADADTELTVFQSDFWALVNHVMYQAFSGDHKESNPAWAQFHYSAFLVETGNAPMEGES